MAKRVRASRKKKVPAAAPAEETPAEQAKSSEVRVAISQKKLRALMSSARSATKDVSEKTGWIREKIGHAVENDHLHPKVFSLIRTLDRMEPEKLADYLDCLEHYLDISGLNQRAAQVTRLQFGPGASEAETGEEAGEEAGAEEEGEQSTDQTARNVRPFQRPQSVAGA